MAFPRLYAVGTLLLSGPALACTIEYNEIAYLVPFSKTIVTGEVVAEQDTTYDWPEVEDFSIEVTQSATFRVTQVLKGSVATETIELRPDLGEPDWDSTCGPYTYAFHEYDVGRHFLLMLGEPQADGSYRARGRLRQSVIQIPDSDDLSTGLTEYVRYTARADGRPVGMEFRVVEPAVAGGPVTVDMDVSNPLPFPVGIWTGPGERPEMPEAPALFHLSLGPTPDLRAERPAGPISAVVPANSTRTVTLPLGAYFEFDAGRYGLTGSANLMLRSTPEGGRYGDGWGNFGAMFRFEVTDPVTAAPLRSWGEMKSGHR